ncbi:unnamed protein product, partial [Closterium sp. NIES-54]
MDVSGQTTSGEGFWRSSARPIAPPTFRPLSPSPPTSHPSLHHHILLPSIFPSSPPVLPPPPPPTFPSQLPQRISTTSPLFPLLLQQVRRQ